MIEGKYTVVLKTPLGPKKGTAILKVNGNILSGSLEALGKSNPFESGKVDGNKFTFKGVLQTPLGKIPYEAVGVVEGDNLRAIAKTSKGNMEVTGKRV